MERISQQAVRLQTGESREARLQKAAQVTPAPRQLAWQQLELTAFIHFGMNTFSDREWGDGTESPALFRPAELDADQWVRVLQGAGFRGMILTCKHHDGFCLWPSAHTEYSVKNAPWKGGRGDVVKEMADACRRAGMKFGVYLSPWDRHDPRYGDSPAYNAYFLAQLEELLTNYGDIFEVWFDGACAEGPNGKKQEYDWAAYFALIRRLQPDAVISIEGPDVRWVGNEAGRGRESEWSVYPYGRLVTAGDQGFLVSGEDCTKPDLGSDELLAALDPRWEYLFWYPAQVDTSIRPGWFYHTWEDEKVKPLHELVRIYQQSVGNNAQLLLNIPPDTRGKISEPDIRRLEEFGRYRQAAYGVNLAADVPMESRQEAGRYITSLTLPQPAACNQVVLMEDITRGQHVVSYGIRAYRDGVPVSETAGHTVGYKRIQPIPEAVIDRLEVEVTACRAEPVFSFIGLYRAPVVAQPPAIRRNQAGTVTITAGDGAQIDWRENGGAWQPYAGPFSFQRSGRLQARAVYDAPHLFGENGPVTEAVLGLPKTGWRVVSCTGRAVGGGGSADDLADDDRPYVVFEGALPMEVTIDMGTVQTVHGFTCLPVDNIFDFCTNLYAYRLEVSADGETYVTAAEGKFDNLRNNPLLQVVEFGREYAARYIRFTAVSGFETQRVGIGKISLL